MPCIQLFNVPIARSQQIIPAADGTMTIVTPDGTRFVIDGGTLSGDGRNLFHSFQEFGLSAEQIATFLSNPSIENILSRVTGGNPSVINGTIEVVGGNSNLFLMNPAGIIFGSGATLNVPADFTATTSTGISFDGGWFNAFGTNDYANLVGNPNGFSFQTDANGAIINAGNLAVNPGQNLALIAATVVNTGTLQAPGGNITVTAVQGTERVRLSQEGQLLSLEIEPPKSESGQSLPVRAVDLPTLLTGSADTVETGLQVTEGQTVQLTDSGTTIPTDAGTAIVSGTVDASSSQTLGGDVNIFGDRVGIINANIDASGQTGGGTVLIGGDYKGQGTVPNADITVVDGNSTVRSDAAESGDGGRVIVWADGTTAFSGNISARGGENGGNGGFVEVSGKDNLAFRGNVDVGANNGNSGTLLLDPADITVTDGSEATNDGELTDGQILAGDSPGGSFAISEQTLESTSGNVILEATNNITIEDLSDDRLSLSGSSIRFTADADGVEGGSFSMNSGDTIGTNGANIAISGASLTIGQIDTRQTTEIRGDVDLTATGGPIAIAGTDSEENSVIARSITINTPDTLSVTGRLNARTDNSQGSGNVTIGNNLAPSAISVGTISTRNLGGGDGGDINITTTGSLTATDAFSEEGSPAEPSDPNNRSIASEADGNGGDININAGGDITTATGIFSNSRLTGNGGNIALSTGGNIQTGTIDTSAEQGNAGTISLTSSGGSVNIGGLVDTTASGGNGNAVNISTAGNINTGTILTGSQSGNGGNITLTSSNGAIDTTTGTALTAQQIQENFGGAQVNDIQTFRGLVSGAAGNGGQIQLSASGNITTENLLSASLAGGQGGSIALTSTNGEINTSAAQNFSITTPQGTRSLAGTDSSSPLGTGQGGLTVSAANFTVGDNISTDGNILIQSPVTVLANTSINAGPGGITIEQPMQAIGSASIALVAELDITTSSITTGVAPGGNTAFPPDGATLTIFPSSDGNQLAGFIAGPGIRITNVRFTGTTGTTGSAGGFTGGNTAGLGVNRGIILTTGQATTAQGPNDSDSAGTSNNIPGDPELDTVSGGTSEDATAIEINFETTGGPVSINYVFASEEYNEFEASRFNDVFGFFINSSNIAVVPGTNQPVSVNAINQNSNSQLYNNNDPSDLGTPTPFNVQYDGFTNTLTATSPELAPGSYTLKLAIADVGDDRYDSAVFIESFNIGQPGPTSPGNISIISNNGSVTTGNLLTASTTDVNGGNITINAATGIDTGAIDTSSAQGNGGNVILDAGAGISLDTIDAQGGSLGTGGSVNINADQFVRATGTFNNQNNVLTSIATNGGNGGGDITIRHGGNGQTPFFVGDATVNGTAGAVTDGENDITSGSFPFDEIRGDIAILSGVQAPPEPPEPPTPPERDPRDDVLQNNQNVNDPGQFQSSSPTQLAASAPPPIIPVATVDQAREILTAIEQQAAVKPALIYVNFEPSGVSLGQDFAQREASLTHEYEGFLELPSNKAQPTVTMPPSGDDQLELLAITADGEPIRVRIPEATREIVLQTAETFYQKVSELEDGYLPSAQQLYQWLLAPIEAELKARGVDNFLFIMPDGLRLVPIAALHDGKQFVAQKYSTGFAPSLNLIDYRYRDIKDAPVLAFGASQFTADQNQTNLPAVEIEVPLIAQDIRQGKYVLDQQFTLQNLVAERTDNPYPIIHLATHADFQPGELSQSYIQLYNQKIGLNELRQLGLSDPTVELLVISACRSAYGDRDAELGFAGLAVQAGVKTAIASLWYVGDTGTLALMSEFYRQLSTAPIKSEALRLAQVGMIEGRIKKQGNEIISTRGTVPLPPDSVGTEEDLTHPFYWAAFTMIGSPW